MGGNASHGVYRERMMVKFISIFLTVSCFLQAQVKIVKSIHIKSSIDHEGIPKLFDIYPPAIIYEGFSREIIVTRDTFFEVFDAKGRRIKKIGSRGQGPGDFNNIVSLTLYDGKYFFHDWINKISVFTRRFEFEKSFYLGGGRNSQFIHSLDISEGRIYSVQNYLLKPKSRNYDHITVFNLTGKIMKHLFNSRTGLEHYKEANLLSGRILALNQRIFFCYFSIPKVWCLDPSGNILKTIHFGDKWWNPIIYDEREYRKRKEKYPTRALRDLLLSGDRIMKLYSWKNRILVQVVKDPAEDNPKHGVVIFDQNLDILSPPVFYRDYHFCGTGENLFFSRVIEGSAEGKFVKIEVLQCDYRF